MFRDRLIQRIGDLMKFMLVWEYNIEDFDEVLKIMRKSLEEREKHPDKYPKRILPWKAGYWIFEKTGKLRKGFNLYEVENEQQMINMTLIWQSVYHMTWIPIVSALNMIEPSIDFDLMKSS
jgi:hypothetical protein